MEHLWTQTQKAAIETRGTLLVAAGAGSGKTAVLIERILAYIADPREGRDVDEFLVVTFTKAAALEMKTRLRAAIEDKLRDACDPGLSDHLLTQLLLIDKAQIKTLHALGGDLLRQHFHLIGLEPNFHVLEENQAQILLRELTETLINGAYERADDPGADGERVDDPRPDDPRADGERADDPRADGVPDDNGNDRDFLSAAEFFSEGYRDRFLSEAVLSLRRFAMSQPRPREWLEGLAAAYNLDEEGFLESLWGQALLDQGQSLLEESAHVLREAVSLAETSDGPREYLLALDQDVRHVTMLRKLDLKGLRQALVQVIPARLAPVKAKNSGRNEHILEKTKETVKKRREVYKQNLAILKKRWLGSALAEHLALSCSTAGIVRGLVGLTEELLEAYQNEKRRRNCVDFADLEHLPLELLRSVPELAETLRQRYHEVLVDEYQDISPVQEDLLDMLSRQGHRFMVGDIKQSIYRFRMADPGLFNQKYVSFLPWEEKTQMQADNGYVIDMRHNFRSCPGIIDAVNEIFYRLMRYDTAEIDYDSRAELIAADRDSSNEEECVGNMFPNNECVEIHVIERPMKPSKLDYRDPVFWEQEKDPGEAEGSLSPVDYEGMLLDMEAAKLEAHVVAQRIVRLVKEPFMVRDSEGNRPVRYKDIAILKRSAAGVLPLYREVFAEYGIPFSATGNPGGFEAIEVEIVESLLSVIENPHQDIPLLAVLHSFLVGLTPEQLSRVRLACPEGDFYDALCFVEASHDPVLQPVVSRFCRDLRRWRVWASRENLADFLWGLYQETGILNYVGMMSEGKRRRENLLSLYEDAVGFVRFRTQTLGGFLRYRQTTIGGNASRSRELTGSGEFDEVRLMTIHGSKGLEFPVVFVVGLGSRFNRISQSSKVLVHKDLGIGIAGADVKRKVVYPSPVREAVGWVLAREAAAEEMRVFYVALTRAKEKLILVGFCKDLDRTMESLCISVPGDRLTSGRIRRAVSCLEWLEMAFLEGGQSSRICQVIPHRAFDLLKELFMARKEGFPALQATFQEEIPGTVSMKALDEKLLWRYPQEDQLVKVSVTGLKQLLQADSTKFLVYGEEDTPRVDDAAVRRTSVLELGIATHKFFQHIPWHLWSGGWGVWSEELRMETLRGYLRDLVERELIPEDVSRDIPLAKVAVFLSSTLGERIFAADEVETEVPFILNMVFGVKQQRILVQGTPDLVVLNGPPYKGDHGRALVVDFKTDRVKRGSEDLLAEKYVLQMAVYCLAVRKLLGVEVEEALIYAIHTNRCVVVEVEAMREALAEAGLQAV
ncbi:MAG: UvrD-helicase domain-containing protein [Peptococcaceae bacterium]|nr:UvrD-helicase domain-containing protein [Peptococcaceae bacterium]